MNPFHDTQRSPSPRLKNHPKPHQALRSECHFQLAYLESAKNNALQTVSRLEISNAPAEANLFALEKARKAYVAVEETHASTLSKHSTMLKVVYTEKCS